MSLKKVHFVKLNDDVFLYALSFLDQYDISIFSQVCKDFYRLRGKSNHLNYYIVYNSKLAKYVNRQICLKAIVINGVKNIQLFFTRLPEYVFIGHNSTFHPTNIYNGMITGPNDQIKYPDTKVLFIEESQWTVDWEAFPNLEELYILTSQLDLNIDNLWKCTKLKKVIIKLNYGLIYVANRKVTELPELEIFAVSGTMKKGGFETKSPKLHTCIFFSTPMKRYDDVYYLNYFSNRSVSEIEKLFHLYHRPPAIITNNIRKMYNHSL